MTHVHRHPGVALHELADGTLALTDPDRGTMLVVSEVGAAVWLLLDACDTVDALAASIRETLPGAPPSVRADVEAFLAELAAHGMTV